MTAQSATVEQDTGRSQVREIAGAAFSISVATATLAISQWVIMVAIGHVGGAGELGTYALAQAYALPTMFISWLGIRSLLVMSTNSRLDDLVALRIIVPAVIFVATFVIVSPIYMSIEFTLILGITLLTKYNEGFFDLAYGLYQGNRNAPRVAYSAILRTAIVVAIFVPTYMLTKNIIIALLINFITSTLLFVVIDSQLLRKASVRVIVGILDGKAFRQRAELFRELVPLSLASFVSQIAVSAPRLVIEHAVGSTALGQYSAIMAFITIGAIAAASIGYAVLPGLSKAFAARSLGVFIKLLAVPSALLIFAGLIGALVARYVGSTVMDLIYGHEFAEAGGLLVVGSLVAGPVFCSMIVGLALIAVRAYSASMYVQLASLAAVVALASWLTSVMGIEGTLMASGIAAVIQVVLTTIVLAVMWKETPRGPEPAGANEPTWPPKANSLN